MTDKHPSTVNLFFGDGPHDFALPYDQLLQLEKLLDEGPMHTLSRFEQGTWSPLAVYEIVRLGLIGGGASTKEAYELAQQYVVQRPICEPTPTAVTVLTRAIMGAPPVAEPEVETAANG